MKKLLSLLAILAIMMSACQSYDDDINNIKDRLDTIEGTHIASIKEQLSAIKSSLPELEKASKELKNYIEVLQTTAGNLQKSIEATNTKIEETKAALQEEMSTEKAELLEQLSKLKEEMEGELAKVNTTIEALQQKDAELDLKIDNLTTYVNTELANNKEWANATFATLQQYREVAGEIETIKSQIETINQSLTNIESRLSEKITTELNSAVASLDASIQQKVSEIVTGYQEAISTAKEDITNAYTAAIESAITNLETLLKGWVCDQLKGYFTIAEVEGRLAALQNIIDANDSALLDEIGKLQETLESINRDITSRYTVAIEEAISQNNGVIDTKIAIAIAEINVHIENEIKSLNTKIATIEHRLSALESDIATIGEQIIYINHTIENLLATKAQLEEYIQGLQQTSNDLVNAIPVIRARISEVEAALQEELSESKAELLDKLAQLEHKMEEELNQINNTIAAMEEKHNELNDKIELLRHYVDTELAKNRDWANATFATLEQYTDLTYDIARIKAQIEYLNNSVAGIEDYVNEKIADEIGDIVNSLTTYTQNKVKEATDACQAAIAEANEQLASDLMSALQHYITQLEYSMKEWVNEQLAGYYTIAQVDAKIATLQQAIASGDSSLRSELSTLSDAISELRSQIANSYKAAIEDAINENNGVIDGKIARAINEVNTLITREITTINAKIASIEDRLNKVENDIASINEQIENINNTISTLHNTQNELRSYIESLQTTANDLVSAIDHIRTKIYETEQMLRDEISTAKAEVLAQLNSMKSELESELAQINATIDTLKAKDAELDQKITDLRSYVNTELANNRSWANATFATLEQYHALANEVATIKAQIEAINRSITDLESRTNTKIDQDIAAAVSNLNSTLQEKITEITSAYRSAVATAKAEITAAYTEAIKNAIAESESSMKSWVHEQLAGYYTIAEVEALLATLKEEFNSQLNTQRAYLESLINSLSANSNLNSAIQNNANAIAQNAADILALQQNLAKAKEEITEAYKAAITTAIDKLNGELRNEIAAQISTVNARISTEISAVNASIKALEGRVATLESEVNAIRQQIIDILNDIANLMKRIQSVTYIPQYADGKATMVKTHGLDEGVAEFDFQISPKDAVADILANWQSILSMKAVYTQSRDVSFIELPILSCKADTSNGVISMTVSGENLSEEFFAGNQTASAALYISDGNNSIISNYVNMLGWYADNIYFSDANFKAYLVKSFDTNKDNEISKTEALSITEINVESHGSPIESLSGIEFMTNLTTLNCANNRIKRLDLHLNDKLQTIVANDNLIEEILLSQSVVSINVCNNRIQSVDLSNCVMLEQANFSDNKLINDIDISNCPLITDIYLFNNNLSNIYVWDACTNTNCSISYDYDTALVKYKNGNIASKFFIGQYIPIAQGGVVVSIRNDGSNATVMSVQEYEHYWWRGACSWAEGYGDGWQMYDLGYVTNITSYNSVKRALTYGDYKQLTIGYADSTSPSYIYWCPSTQYQYNVERQKTRVIYYSKDAGKYQFSDGAASMTNNNFDFKVRAYIQL